MKAQKIQFKDGGYAVVNMARRTLVLSQEGGDVAAATCLDINGASTLATALLATVADMMGKDSAEFLVHVGEQGTSQCQVTRGLREALADLDRACDDSNCPLQKASITASRAAVELVLADVLRSRTADTEPPAEPS